MGIFSGSTEIESIHYGSTEIAAVYHGSTLIWPDPVITFVGSSANAGQAAEDPTIDLSGLSLEEDDYVVAAVAVGTASGSHSISCSGDETGSYTSIANVVSDDNADTRLAVFGGRMGATPDDTVTFDTNFTGPAKSTLALVFRGVDTTTALDVAAVTTSQINGGVPNTGAITPTNDGSMLVAIAATKVTGALSPDNTDWQGGPTGFSSVISASNFNEMLFGAAYMEQETAATFAADSFSHNTTLSSVALSMSSVMIALRRA